MPCKVKDVKSIEELAANRHARNINQLHEENLTFGDRVSDKIADVAGSWIFIIIFVIILISWIIVNSMQLTAHIFDPFPYILLNLVLSCIAALQAPIIMMSQNRQEEKDRIRAEHDYEINLKSEILIEEIIKRLDKIEKNQQVLLNELPKKK